MTQWLYGRNPVYEVLRAGRRKLFRLWLAEGVQEKGRLRQIVELAASLDIPLERLSRQRLDTLTSAHQGVALEVGDFPYASLDEILALARQRGEAPFILILDALQDPQNLATLLRTAEALAVHGVLLPPRRSATVTPAVVSASSGASEHLLIAQQNLVQAIKTLQEHEVWVVGMQAGSEAQPPAELRLDGPLALVVGGESQGMRRLVRESCDLLLRLPLRGQLESLNAAVAGSIGLFLAYQARSAERGGTFETEAD